ncbi:DUF3989 domain-containing protein [Dysgonomonas sp. 216]|uniref:TraL conjugative transposon family protein n=1 Tax=Dysgonomonas sp. 216 TaxID=2302934 RepID=UPI0013D12F21|nr:TraL conjugative transposon family protein [Dysgonomonas sp. 216]NDW18776.1 DUF3989 domain-containing protein [Dysgonomonas sp. 216]
MKEKLKDIAYRRLEDWLKDLCGELTPDKRIMVILIMLLILTIGNLYFTFSTIYNWGRESEKKKQLKLEHIRQPGLEYNKNKDYDFMDSPIDKGGFSLPGQEIPKDSADSIMNNNNKKFNEYERTIKNKCRAQAAT